MYYILCGSVGLLNFLGKKHVRFPMTISNQTKHWIKWPERSGEVIMICSLHLAFHYFAFSKHSF